MCLIKIVKTFDHSIEVHQRKNIIPQTKNRTSQTHSNEHHDEQNVLINYVVYD